MWISNIQGAVVVDRRSFSPEPEPIPEIKADHPFVYYIWDKESDAAVFSGRITKFD